MSVMHWSYEPLRGFRDYLPPDSETLTWICDTFKEVARLFGYREIKTPTVESTKLFEAKSGEEIKKSMFVFVDKGGREVALRPEVTPSVVRVYLRELKTWPKPIRLFYIANVFRYDEPQFGRYREFTQAGVEILGADGLHYDIELVLLLEEFYDRLGLKDRGYKVNNVAIFRGLASLSGLEEQEVEKVLYLMDKGLFYEAAKMLQERGHNRYAALLNNMASLSEAPDKLSRLEELLIEVGLLGNVGGEVERLRTYVETLRSLGVKVRPEPSFVRGIAYYTGIIFEVEVPGLGVSIAGGGRYDNLTTVYGGEELPSTGFAIGVERTMLALQERVQRKRSEIKVLVVSLADSNEALKALYGVAKQLRNAGYAVQAEVSPPHKLGRWLEYANKTGFTHVVIIGAKELERGTAIIRDMRSWSQIEVTLNYIVEGLKRHE